MYVFTRDMHLVCLRLQDIFRMMAHVGIAPAPTLESVVPDRRRRSSDIEPASGSSSADMEEERERAREEEEKKLVGRRGSTDSPEGREHQSINR